MLVCGGGSAVPGLTQKVGWLRSRRLVLSTGLVVGMLVHRDAPGWQSRTELYAASRDISCRKLIHLLSMQLCAHCSAQDHCKLHGK